eukprot:762893-Hanusia_phi.AAC.1
MTRDRSTGKRIAELASDGKHPYSANQAISNLGAYIMMIHDKKDVNAIKSLSFSLFSGEWSLLQTSKIKDETACRSALVAMKQHLERCTDQNLELDLKQITDICKFCLRLCDFDKSSQTKGNAYQLLGQCLGAKITSRQRSTDEHKNMLIRVCESAVKGLFNDRHLSGNSTLLSEVIEVCNCLCFVHPHVLDSCIISDGKSAYTYYRNALSSRMRAAGTLQAKAGCLSGMRGLMKHSSFISIEESSTELMKQCAEEMWSSLNGSTKLTRYKVVKASLKLVGECSRTLAKHLIEKANAQQICEALLRWCKHSNSEVRSAALSAFDTWTSQAKEYIRTEEEVEILNAIYQKIMDEEQEKNENYLKCISLSFRGRGSLAWHVAFHKMNILDNFLLETLRYWNLLLSEQNGEEQGDVIYEILPDFVISIANILVHLPVSGCTLKESH